MPVRRNDAEGPLDHAEATADPAVPPASTTNCLCSVLFRGHTANRMPNFIKHTPVNERNDFANRDGSRERPHPLGGRTFRLRTPTLVRAGEKCHASVDKRQHGPSDPPMDRTVTTVEIGRIATSRKSYPILSTANGLVTDNGIDPDFVAESPLPSTGEKRHR